MFNATALLGQWNKANPADQRRLDKFWDTTHLDKLMSEIVENETIPSSPKSGYDETGVNFNELKNY